QNIRDGHRRQIPQRAENHGEREDGEQQHTHHERCPFHRRHIAPRKAAPCLFTPSNSGWGNVNLRQRAVQFEPICAEKSTRVAPRDRNSQKPETTKPPARLALAASVFVYQNRLRYIGKGRIIRPTRPSPWRSN